MLVKKYLTQRLAPLQAHSCPLWSLKGAEDNLRLHPEDLTDEELSKTFAYLAREGSGRPSGVLPPAVPL